MVTEKKNKQRWKKQRGKGREKTVIEMDQK